MEKTDSVAKQQALDGKGAFAGTTEPTTHQSIESIAKDAGVSIPQGGEIGVKALLDKRDKNRWELSPESENPNAGINR